jgi:hypothetical protein
MTTKTTPKAAKSKPAVKSDKPTKAPAQPANVKAPKGLTMDDVKIALAYLQHFEGNLSAAREALTIANEVRKVE